MKINQVTSLRCPGTPENHSNYPPIFVASRRWQLARKSFPKYSSALRQTSQNLSSATKIRQHDVDKFMKSDKLNKSVELVKKMRQYYAVNSPKWLL